MREIMGTEPAANRPAKSPAGIAAETGPIAGSAGVALPRRGPAAEPVAAGSTAASATGAAAAATATAAELA